MIQLARMFDQSVRGQHTGMRFGRRRSAVLAITALLAMATVAACTSSPSAPAPSSTAARCSAPDPANPVFSHISGNHLIDTRGQVMIPYGITIFGLALQDWQAQAAQDRRQIKAAITMWCTNYVRLMIAPASLVYGRFYNPAYLAEVRSEVQLALSYGNNVILSAQTERWSGNQPAGGPTQQTIEFWRVLAPLYDHNPRVWFDVFNEPRLETGNLWGTWQYGGMVAGQYYIGMQQLVSAVRAAAGRTNLIIVEGPQYARTLSGVPTHRITGANLAYGVHPYGLFSAAQWNPRFGQVASTLPVLADEWAVTSVPKRGRCGLDLPGWVPAFFAYLRARQIGLGAWGLLPGVLVTNTTNFTPTRLVGSATCLHGAKAKAVLRNRARNGGQAVEQSQGVGQLVQQYFIRYAHP
jgi:hypothetical protein